MYLAHKDDSREESILEHLRSTKAFAEEFAAPFDAREEAGRVAMAHDIGKYSMAFQKRIRGSSVPVDHASAGAQLLAAEQDFPGAIAVAGHHGGMPDFGSKVDTAEDVTLSGRIKRQLPDFSPYQREVTIGQTCHPDFARRGDGFCRCMYTRMLFSCLVDGDFLATEGFMQQGRAERGGYEPLPSLKEKFFAFAREHWSSEETLLNQARCDIRRKCVEAARKGPGLYSLTVPTGGAKTAATMAFALESGKRRILYVIPYTSIIEQNAGVFAHILGEENVVAHHCHAEFSNTEPETDRRYLSAENWDAPIIVTTAVQFFESLFSNRPGKCRKLHNISDSVIIFDEAQMLPLCYLRPCVAAIGELVKHYGVTAVLCTATQPSLDGLFADCGLKITEICPELPTQVFQRVTYRNDGTLDAEALSKALQEEDQVLCICNTKKSVKALYETMPLEGRFYLTTNLTANHRTRKLAEIQERLKAGLPCRVIATSLVEAGVDLDFPTVYRELSGMDSLVQAAGRCNREGKRAAEKSLVHIFDLGNPVPDMLCPNVEASRSVLRSRLPDDPKAVKKYYKRLYKSVGSDTLDTKGIMKDCQKPYPMKTVSEKFHIIENNTAAVYVPNDNNKPLIELLRRGLCTRAQLRKLGRDAVSVYPGIYKTLLSAGALEPISSDAAILAWGYCEETGLDTDQEGGNAWII